MCAHACVRACMHACMHSLHRYMYIYNYIYTQTVKFYVVQLKWIWCCARKCLCIMALSSTDTGVMQSLLWYFNGTHQLWLAVMLVAVALGVW